MRSLFQTNGGWTAFVLRVALGIVFLAHGAQLTLGWFGGHVFSETMTSFVKMGMPAPVAALVILAQFLGGLGLLVGLLTRIAAFGNPRLPELLTSRSVFYETKTGRGAIFHWNPDRVFYVRRCL